MYVGYHVCASALDKRELNPLELELQEAMSHVNAGNRAQILFTRAEQFS